MAGRSSPSTPAPVVALLQAFEQRDLHSFARVLAEDARIDVPPLHIAATGRLEATGAVNELLYAFPDLRYTLRQRYLAPGAVTDEGVLHGTQAGVFLGAPPTGREGVVPVRIMVQHDEQQVTGLTVWPEVGSVREFLEGLPRTVDLTGGSSAPAFVASLRASMPSAKESRLIVGTSRQGSPPPPPAPPPAAPATPTRAGGAGGRAGKEAPKAPLPRKVRRRRAVAAAAVMLTVSGGLVTWVARGALEKDGTSLADGLSLTRATESVRSSPVAQPSATPTPTPSPTSSSAGAREEPTLRVEDAGAGRLRIVAPSDLLFATGEAVVRPETQRNLEAFVQRVVAQARQTRVIERMRVSGYTDSVGTAAYNQRLSLQRARAVKDVLDEALAGSSVKIDITAQGRGISNAYPNTTEEGKAKNRRVTIEF